MTHSRTAVSRRGLGIRPGGANWGARSHSACYQTCAFSQQAAAFERSSAHLARKPSTRRDSRRKATISCSGFEPKRCSRALRAHERVGHASNVDLCSHVRVPCEQSKSMCACFTTGKAKTPPKWRTQEWHLSDAAWTPSQPAHIHMQGRGVQAADQQALKH